MLNFQQYIIHQSYFIFIISNKLQNLWGIILLLNKAIRSQFDPNQRTTASRILSVNLNRINICINKLIFSLINSLNFTPYVRVFHRLVIFPHGWTKEDKSQKVTARQRTF